MLHAKGIKSTQPRLGCHVKLPRKRTPYLRPEGYVNVKSRQEEMDILSEGTASEKTGCGSELPLSQDPGSVELVIIDVRVCVCWGQWLQWRTELLEMRFQKEGVNGR